MSTTRPEDSGLIGLLGRPYIDLSEHLDLEALPAIHEEVCLALAKLPTEYTGGCHRSMGIMPEGREHEALVDYGEVIASLDDESFATFVGLADDPRSIDVSARETLTFGEERDHPLSRPQMLWLKLRHGVYFPWKVYMELIPNRYWTEKASYEGKRFTRVAETHLPRTIAFVKTLPFEGIGRCNIMGLEAHDHGTVHRDGLPGEQSAPDHFITLCPGPDKHLYLYDPTSRERVDVRGKAYWFNDHDYHGVDAAPYFRYSIRVDGVFREDFLARLAHENREP